ncbi:MAG: hypothetical protein HY791_15270 [Deltaproteobacteria bacterium]|nr:hypothetical protein [Deltaproteobacteria bacterium]
MTKKVEKRDAEVSVDAERLSFVRELISIFERSGLTRFDYEDEDVALVFERPSDRVSLSETSPR